MSANINAITDISFETDVLEASGPVLVDFWAEWCGPCRALAPTLETIATEYGSRLKIAKMDVDANTETPAKYAVRGIPTLMLFNQGQLLGTKVGSLSKQQLTAFLDEHLEA